MNYEILDIKTAQKIAKLEKENNKLKLEKENLKEEIRFLKDKLYKYTTKFN